MKNFLLFLTLIFFFTLVQAQEENSSHFSAPQLQKIKTETERKVLVLKQKLSNEGFISAGSIEFITDTFRLEETARLKMDIAQSSAAMNEVIYTQADEYDKLLNKYYNRLMKLLGPEDQNSLLQAQRAWLSFRDSEQKLITTLSAPQYSGGGSMVSNTLTYQYADLVIQRALDIGEYYSTVADNQE